MRAIVQRAERAEVRVHEPGGVGVAGSIGRGLVVLLGVEARDTDADAAWMASKLAGLRVFEDEAGKMNLGLAEVGGSVLLVPNFTVAGSAAKGRRPDFTNAMKPPEAERLFGAVRAGLLAAGVPVETGVFGGDMRVELVNDGPVTLVIKSPG
ncbi:MAG: D-tyrosyl-tRNA(Tyr) deacylase [Phycisphaerales bacterium]|nr:D-tyrosyl-tRNA(Tyr) deacylase [Planctomycetota bacterium]MCH8509718.1 D-tyrosyl-tRNA(Tyr) deacylase [Phycisphaerales bacterium]